MITVGDRVGYGVVFLRSTGNVMGGLGDAQGTVTALIPVGSTLVLAEVAWDADREAGSPRVNVANLARVGSLPWAWGEWTGVYREDSMPRVARPIRVAVPAGEVSPWLREMVDEMHADLERARAPSPTNEEGGPG